MNNPYVSVNINSIKPSIKKAPSKIGKIDLLKDFDHNYILLVNGNYHSSNFDHENKNKIKINVYDKNIT